VALGNAESESRRRGLKREKRKQEDTREGCGSDGDNQRDARLTRKWKGGWKEKEDGDETDWLLTEAQQWRLRQFSQAS